MGRGVGRGREKRRDVGRVGKGGNKRERKRGVEVGITEFLLISGFGFPNQAIPLTLRIPYTVPSFSPFTQPYQAHQVFPSPHLALGNTRHPKQRYWGAGGGGRSKV